MSLSMVKVEDMAEALTEKITANYEFLYFNGKRDAINELKRTLIKENETKNSKELISDLQELENLYDEIIKGLKNGAL